MESTEQKYFIVFRVLFGFYLVIHFAHLVPSAPLLFTTNGMIADPTVSPLYALFPNFLNLSWANTPLFSSCFLAFLSFLSLLLMLGIGRRSILCVFLWLGFASLLNKNILISNPGLAYVGWLLLACALIPSGEKWSSDAQWAIPLELKLGAWLLMALGYTVSGVDKLVRCESWRNGTALVYVLSGPLGRDNLLVNLLIKSPMLMHLLTWGALSLEISFLPLCLTKRGRQCAWLAMVLMHVGVIATIDFLDLTLGVLMIHLFTLDVFDFLSWECGRFNLCSWLENIVNNSTSKPRKKKSRFKPTWAALPEDDVSNPSDWELKWIVLYDGKCGLCQKVRELVRRYDWFDRIRFVNLHDRDSVEKVLPGRQIPPESKLKQEMHLYSPIEKELPVTEFEAVHYICRQLPLGMILALFLDIPPIKYLARLAYQSISDRRLLISQLQGWDRFCSDGGCVIGTK